MIRSFVASTWIGAAAMAGAAASPGDLAEIAEVVSVEVPVHVVGRDGAPVRGLHLDQFRLFDDGEERPISGLEVVDLQSRRPTRAEILSTSGWPPGAARRRILLLFDLAFTDPLAIARSREAASRLIVSRLQPSDLVGVATLDAEHGVRFLVSFTADRAQVVRAVDTLGVPALLDRGPSRDPLRLLVEEPPARRSLVAPPGQSAPPSIAVLASALEALEVGSARAERRQATARADAWVAALVELGESLSRIDGRKQVVLLGQGFESRLAIGHDVAPGDPEGRREAGWLERGESFRVDADARQGSPALRRRLTAAGEALRQGDATVFAIDVGGLRSEVAPSPSIAEAGGDLREGNEVLLQLALETGGELIRAPELDARVAELLIPSEVTYLLRYDPPDLVADGRYHRLRVEATLPPGARLVSRVGYFAPLGEPEAAELARELVAADLIATGSPRSELDVAALAVPFHLPGGAAYVPILVEVDGTRLLERAKPGGVRLEVFAYAGDARGSIVAYASDTVDLGLDPAGRAALAERGVLHLDALFLPAGDFAIRVLVRDAATGRSAVTSVPVHVAAAGDEPEARAIAVGKSEEFLLMRAPPDASAGAEPFDVYPFTVGGQAFVPVPSARLVPGGTLPLVVLTRGLPPGEAALESALRSPDGTLPLPTLDLVLPPPEGDGSRRVAVLLELPSQLPEGVSRIELTLVDRDGRRHPLPSVAVSRAQRSP